MPAGPYNSLTKGLVSGRAVWYTGRVQLSGAVRPSTSVRDGLQKTIVRNETGMDTTSDISPQTQSPKRLPESQRSTYQFPVYRWINWLVIAGYGVGLAIMFLLAGLVGLPAPIVWPFLVFIFCAGVALLGRPKALLAVMMFYFLLMPGNRLFGLLGFPLPGFIDELFFVPFIAVIVMYAIQKRHVQGGLWFPFLWMGLAALSWYVNGKPSPFTTVQVTLVILKFFIIWYFCRLTSTYKEIGEFWRFGELYIHYAAIQFLYNCLWQGRPWVTRHWDNSGGMFGPEGTGGAHTVGYISVLALFLLAAWWIGVGPRASKVKRMWMLFLVAVITYDLVFMTDTKHALLMMPVAFLPVLFHRSIPAKLRFGVLLGGAAVTMVGFMYFISFTSSFEMMRFVMVMNQTPKGEAYRAVTTDFPHLVPYPLFGAGPGRFFSAQAVDGKAPLARRYVVPYVEEAKRSKVAHVSGTRTGGSLLAWPQSDVLAVTGEYGWVGMSLYTSFILWVFVSLWRKADSCRSQPEIASVCLCLAAGVVFLFMTMFFASTATVPCLMFPWWMLVGRIWDLNPMPKETVHATALLDGEGTVAATGDVASPQPEMA